LQKVVNNNTFAHLRHTPEVVDLEAMKTKPFKDATELDSIRKLEEKLGDVASKVKVDALKNMCIQIPGTKRT
jgi:hypothetical protein